VRRVCDLQRGHDVYCAYDDDDDDVSNRTCSVLARSVSRAF
jgi:hypothetical protein